MSRPRGRTADEARHRLKMTGGLWACGALKGWPWPRVPLRTPDDVPLHLHGDQETLRCLSYGQAQVGPSPLRLGWRWPVVQRPSDTGAPADHWRPFRARGVTEDTPALGTASRNHFCPLRDSSSAPPRQASCATTASRFGGVLLAREVTLLCYTAPCRQALQFFSASQSCPTVLDAPSSDKACVWVCALGPSQGKPCCDGGAPISENRDKSRVSKTRVIPAFGGPCPALETGRGRTCVLLLPQFQWHWGRERADAPDRHVRQRRGAETWSAPERHGSVDTSR